MRYCQVFMHMRLCCSFLIVSVLVASIDVILCDFSPSKTDVRSIVQHDQFSTDHVNIHKRTIQVRVLLCEIPEKAICTIQCTQGFIFIDPKNPRRRIPFQETTAQVVGKNGRIYINGKRLTREQVIIQAAEGNSSLVHDKKTYMGSFYVVCHNNSTLLINCLDLEDYVYSVLYWEGWPNWPLEMNKILAIAIRTYTLAIMCDAVAQKKPYHIKNTIINQVYGGIHQKHELRDAVEQTRGIIMTYQNKPIMAMYDACCGGVIPAFMKSVSNQKTPYLARTTPCNYCKKCKFYRWQASFEKEALARLLREQKYPIHDIQSVAVTKKDKAGIVQEVMIKTAHGAVPIPGKKIYGLPGVKSFSYTMRTTPCKIIIDGCGYGHHKGLCQWGARELVEQGWHCKGVLRFYYPGIMFKRLVR